MAATRGQKKAAAATRKLPRAAANGAPEPTAGDYAKQAISEWAKAARFAAAALSPAVKGAAATTKTKGPPLKDRLNPAKTQKGGRLGDAADFLLDKAGGKTGTLASRLSMGSRIVGRLRGDKHKKDNQKAASPAKGGEQRDEGGSDGWAGKPIPIQESIEIALPVKTAYELARGFDDYPEFIDRIEDVERIHSKASIFEVKLHGATHELRVDVVDERKDARIDWEASGDLEHSGVVSFHPLAPSLTRVELTIDFEPHGLIERLARMTHLTNHTIRADMHRFKAWAELWEAPEFEQPENEPEEPEEQDPEELPEAYEDEEEYEDEEDEGDEEEEPDEDEELVDEEDYDEQDMEYEYDDEDEPAPARAG